MSQKNEKEDLKKMFDTMLLMGMSLWREPGAVPQAYLSIRGGGAHKVASTAVERWIRKIYYERVKKAAPTPSS